MEDHQPEHYFRRVSKNRGKVSAQEHSDESEGCILVGCLEVRGAVLFHCFGVCQARVSANGKLQILRRGVPKIQHVIKNSICVSLKEKVEIIGYAVERKTA